MDDGFVQFLFVVILIFASLLDAVSRGKRKRRGPTGELPPEEEGATRPPVRTPRPTRAPTTRRPAGTRRAGDAPTRPTEAQGGGGPADRETADTLVPDELWAVLTGEAPPTRVPRPRAPEAEPWSDEEDRWTGEGVPYPREGESTEAETWRPESTTEELPTTEAPAEVLPEDERRRPSAPLPWVLVPTEMRPRVHAPATAAAPSPAPAAAARRVVSAPLAVHATRRSPAARYADLLRTGGVDSLRMAVVLREVLDPPVALRRLE
jgi:hypothetical protein